MDNTLAKRLEKIEGLLTKHLIECKIAQKMSDRAYDLATQALVEIRSAEKSTHETKYINAETYNQMFPQTNYGPDSFSEEEEKKEESEEKVIQTVSYPFDSLRMDNDLSEFEDEVT